MFVAWGRAGCDLEAAVAATLQRSGTGRRQVTPARFPGGPGTLPRGARRMTAKALKPVSFY